MRKSDDRMFYAGYGGVFISLGLWILLWALTVISAFTALLLWVLTIGIITIGASGGETAKKAGAQRPQFGIIFGFFLIILSSSLLGANFGLYSYWVALGLIIILTGTGLYFYGLSLKD
jgi:membrane protein insertase Oxa1/YidC/SpoIIIJ